MPFGLCNAPQSLCRLMHKVIPYHLHDRVFVYLDDLLIVSADLEEHFALLTEVARLLKQANLTINVEKSKFVLRETKYLGHVIGNGIIRMDPDKVQAIANYPTPQTVKQLRRFLGMAGWYQRFIFNFASISAPLTDLLKRNQKLNWNESAENAFNQLKTSLTSAPVLRNADFKREFYIQCDASSFGIGSVLFQKSDEGEEHPIAFFSHKLNSAQRKYSVTELECLAAVLSVKKFRPYVEGYTFTIITDHSSLKWLMDQRDLSGRLARWSLKLQGFSFKIQYRKGSQNVVPDALSRVDIEALTQANVRDDDGSVPPLHVDLNSIAFEDTSYVGRINALKENPTIQSNFTELNGKLYILPNSNYSSHNDLSAWKLVIPDTLANTLIKQAHNAPTGAHLGQTKTLEVLQRQFYWSTMARDVKNYVNSCDTCKQTKSVNFVTKPQMGKFTEIHRPFQKLFMDFLGPYPRSKHGNTFLLIILDQYTKFIFAEPLKSATAKQVVSFLKFRIFSVFGVPEILTTDNGPQFRSHLLADLLSHYGVFHQFTPVYSPQSNSSERVNRSILSAIRSYVSDDHRNWDEHLPEISSALRNSVHGSTGFSPYFLTFGQHMVNHASSYKLMRNLDVLNDRQASVMDSNNRLSIAQELVLSHLRNAYQRNCTTYNLRSKPRTFEPGQDVFIRNFVQSSAGAKFSAKLAPKFIKGKIIKRIGSVSYEVGDHNGKTIGIYHTKDLR